MLVAAYDGAIEDRYIITAAYNDVPPPPRGAERTGLETGLGRRQWTRAEQLERIKEQSFSRAHRFDSLSSRNRVFREL